VVERKIDRRLFVPWEQSSYFSSNCEERRSIWMCSEKLGWRKAIEDHIRDCLRWEWLKCLRQTYIKSFEPTCGAAKGYCSRFVHFIISHCTRVLNMNGIQYFLVCILVNVNWVLCGKKWWIIWWILIVIHSSAWDIKTSRSQKSWRRRETCHTMFNDQGFETNHIRMVQRQFPGFKWPLSSEHWRWFIIP